MNELEIIIKKEQAGIRIDRIITSQIKGVARNYIQKLFDEGLVLKDEKPIPKNYKPKSGNKITIKLKQREQIKAKAQDIPINIVYEDDEMLVIDKKKGMVVHPAPGNESGTLVNGLLMHCGNNLSNIKDEIRPGIVHRLDKDTSGLLMVAKTDRAHINLANQLKSHKVKRIYSAIVCGDLKKENGTINMPIGRDKRNRKKMAVEYSNSKEAVTEFCVVKRYINYTHIDLELKTGRTHQIRVHMAKIGHPVAGDQVYGKVLPIRQGRFRGNSNKSNKIKEKLNAQQRLNGQCLHAKTIEFQHPKTGEKLRFDSSLPQYFTDFLKTLKEVNDE